MEWYTFGLLLYANLPTYLYILAGSVVLYFLIFKGTYISFLDPLMFNLLFSMFGLSVVIFLYVTQSMRSVYLTSYLLTQIAFFLGLFIYKPLQADGLVSQRKQHMVFEQEGLLVKLLFIVTSLVFVVIQLLSYKLIGIPVLLKSRVGAYVDSGGLGILGRVIEVLRPATMFLLIYMLFKPGKSALFWIYIISFSIFLLASLALSGSKGLFMSAGFVLFIYLILNADKQKKSFFNLSKYGRYIIVVGMAFAFLTIFIQSQSSNPADENGITIFLFRLVASGDTYYFSYPNDYIETIDGSKNFMALFGEIFSVLRIVPRESQPTILGIQLFQIFSGEDLITGPNARHNVFGYIYYGFYGSIVFSFAIGWMLSFVRNKLFYLLKRNVLGQIAFLYLYLNLSFLETDPPLAINGLENVILIFPVFVAVAMVLHAALCRPKVDSSIIQSTIPQ